MRQSLLGSAAIVPPTQRGNDSSHDLKPITVPVYTACQLLGLGLTKVYELIGAGEIETITIGRRRLVVYASLEALTQKRAA